MRPFRSSVWLPMAWGGLDILVTNAGAASQGGCLELEDNAWAAGFGLKMFANLRVIRHAGLALRGSGSRAMLPRSSPFSVVGNPAGCKAPSSMLTAARTKGPDSYVARQMPGCTTNRYAIEPNPGQRRSNPYAENCSLLPN